MLTLAAMAGCLGGGDDPEPTTTATPTPTPTETEAPASSPAPTPTGVDREVETSGDALDEWGLSPRLVSGIQDETFTHDVDPTLRVFGQVFLPNPETVLPGKVLPETLPTILVISPYSVLIGAGPTIYDAGLAPEDEVMRFDSYLINEAPLRGYAVAFVDGAGTGGTGSCSDFMGPNERLVARGAIEGVRAQPWSNGLVGMTGISWLGMYQIVAASQQPEGLVTIVPIAPMTHWYGWNFQQGLRYENFWQTGVLIHGLMSVPPVHGTAGTDPTRYPGYLQSLASSGTCAPGNLLDYNDPLGRYNEWYQDRDYRSFASSLEASVFYLTGFRDLGTRADNIVPWFNDITAPKKAWFGQWGHYQPDAPHSGRDDFYLTLHRWFDHWLKGIENGMDDEVGIDVMDNQGRWRHVQEWPPAEYEKATFYPASGGGLGTEHTPGEFLLDGSLTLVQGQDPVRFVSEPLEATLHMAGTPRFEVEVASDRIGGQLIVELHLLRPNGEIWFISRGGANLHYPDGAAPEPILLTPGVPVQATIELWPTDFLLEEGDRLRVSLQTDHPFYAEDPHLAKLNIQLGKPTRLVLPAIPDVDQDEIFHVGCGHHRQVQECHDAGLEDAWPEEWWTPWPSYWPS